MDMSLCSSVSSSVLYCYQLFGKDGMRARLVPLLSSQQPAQLYPVLEVYFRFSLLLRHHCRYAVPGPLSVRANGMSCHSTHPAHSLILARRSSHSRGSRSRPRVPRGGVASRHRTVPSLVSLPHRVVSLHPYRRCRLGSLPRRRLAPCAPSRAFRWSSFRVRLGAIGLVWFCSSAPHTSRFFLFELFKPSVMLWSTRVLKGSLSRASFRWQAQLPKVIHSDVSPHQQ